MTLDSVASSSFSLFPSFLQKFSCKCYQLMRVFKQ
jgi:hypothetical protein